MSKEEEKKERLNCPYCNPNTVFGASPEFFDQWKIKHDYHPNQMSKKKETDEKQRHNL